MMGSILVFFTLLTVRGLAAVVLGARAGAWFGAALQLVTVVLMFEVFFFLPGVLGTLVGAVTRADPAATAFPPVWFAALHAWVAGEATAVLEQRNDHRRSGIRDRRSLRSCRCISCRHAGSAGERSNGAHASAPPARPCSSRPWRG